MKKRRSREAYVHSIIGPVSEPSLARPATALAFLGPDPVTAAPTRYLFRLIRQPDVVIRQPVVERKRDTPRGLVRLIAKESDALQHNRFRRVLLVLQGRQALEVAGVGGRCRRFAQRWAYAYRDDGIE